MDSNLAYILNLSSRLIGFVGVIFTVRRPIFNKYLSEKTLFVDRKNRKGIIWINRLFLWVGRRMERNMRRCKLSEGSEIFLGVVLLFLGFALSLFLSIYKT